MAEQPSEHFQGVVDYVMGDDESELAKTKAELAYALHSLEREISICAETQRRLEYMENKYGKIDWDRPHTAEGRT
jgi:hypothetical protein